MTTELGRFLRQRRINDLEMTLQQIANVAGTVPMVVSDIERGKWVPAKRELIYGLARAYEMDAEDFEILAMKSRSTIQLDTSTEGARRDTGIALARAWDEFTPEDLDDLRDLIDRSTERKGGGE